MISKEQAVALNYLASVSGRITLEDAENQFMAGTISDWFALEDMGLASGIYRHGDTFVRITDTGRLRLEEYENFQEQGRLLAEWSHAEANENAPVVSDAAKIAALEAENAARRQLNGALALIADRATKERDALRGLLAKALDAIAPVEAVVSDEHITNKPDYAMLLVEDMNSTKFQVEALSVGKSDCDEWMFFNAGHLRNIATIAADIRAALDPTTPYEDTPDGSDLLARDTEEGEGE